MAFIKLLGPATQWFGFGFGSEIMNNSYSIIIDGNGNLEQRVLGDWTAGRLLDSLETSNFTIWSNIVVNDTRIVTLVQDLDSSDIDSFYYNFGTQLLEKDSLEFMLASSESVELETHDWRESGSVEIDSETSSTITDDDDDDSGGETVETTGAGDSGPNDDDTGSGAVARFGLNMNGMSLIAIACCLLVTYVV